MKIEDRFLLADFAMMARLIENSIRRYGREWSRDYYMREVLLREKAYTYLRDREAILTAFGL